MKSKLAIAASLIASIALPLTSLAATYTYINTSGHVSTVVAGSAAQALAVSDIARYSGVMLNTLTTTTTVTPTQTGTLHTYAFVNKSGNVSYVQATNAYQAMSMSSATISPSSGVMLVN